MQIIIQEKYSKIGEPDFVQMKQLKWSGLAPGVMMMKRGEQEKEEGWRKEDWWEGTGVKEDVWRGKEEEEEDEAQGCCVKSCCVFL